MKKRLKIVTRYAIFNMFVFFTKMEEDMQRSLLTIVLLAVFAVITIAYNTNAAEEIRVWGGKLDDFKDSRGRI